MSRKKRRALSWFRLLPCLRCGRLAVGYLLPLPIVRAELEDLICKRCGEAHFLALRKEGGNCLAIYDRDTRRYPSDRYDEQPVALIKHEDVPLSNPDDGDAPFPGRGPIILFVRKGYFSRRQVLAISKNTNGKCHLCKKKKGRFQNVADTDGTLTAPFHTAVAEKMQRSWKTSW